MLLDLLRDYRKTCTIGRLQVIAPEVDRLRCLGPLIHILEPEYGLCIAEGEYELIPNDTGRHRGGFEILNVPGRTNIEVHKGNYRKDTEGCQLPGLQDNGDWVGRSARALHIVRYQWCQNRPVRMRIRSR